MREINIPHPIESDIYASMSDVFGHKVCWRSAIYWLGNLTFSFVAAFAVFLLIPLLKWFTAPSPGDLVPCDPIGQVDIAPPVPYVPPTPPKPKDEDRKPIEVIPFRPDIDALDLRPLPGVDGGISIPGWAFDRIDVASIDDTLELDDVDEVPRAIKQIAPGYPIELKRRGICGRVLLEFVVNEKGDVIQPRVLKGEYPAFNKASTDAIRKWKFQPATKLGKAVKVRMRLPMDFNVSS